MYLMKKLFYFGNKNGNFIKKWPFLLKMAIFEVIFRF